MTPKEILDKMLTLTNELAKLNKELESQEYNGAEWLTINAIEKAVHAARTVYEQRVNQKENQNG